MKIIFVSFITLSLQCIVISQQVQNPEQSTNFSRQGQVFFSWGYNREQFSKSDIYVKGTGYDFTLYNVKASDRPSDLSAALFLNPFNVSIPQFNFRFGYYLNDRMSITFGYDHMKYVVDQLQTVLISGTIDKSASTKYAGSYSKNPIQITSDFFWYEHTNGLNYFSLAGEYLLPVYKSKSEKFRMHLELGGEFAFLMPRTDVFFFNTEGINEFQIAGYGLNFNTGLRLDVGRHFFFRTCVKAGFINLPNVLTYRIENNYAKQHFFFLQEYATVSYAFWLNTSWSTEINKKPNSLLKFPSS